MLLLLPSAASLYCSSFYYQDENMNVASLTKCSKSLIVLHLISKIKPWLLLLSQNAARLCFSFNYQDENMDAASLTKTQQVFTCASLNYHDGNMAAASLAKCSKS